MDYLILAIFIIYLIYRRTHDTLLNISDYSYPDPKDDSESAYRIAILGTNDIHGSAFPLEITHPLTNSTYKYGGLEYLATYVRILRDEWKERFVWLDGGDQFQGAIESKISNGSIITEFFNALQVNASAIGNHEWDYGQPYLYQRLESANWQYLAANILNSTNQTEFLPHTKTVKMLKVGEVQVGVIGLSTVETPFTTSGDLTNIKFVAYRDVIITLAQMLRSQGANAVILTTHIGMRCANDGAKKMVLEMRNKTTSQALCNQEDEMSVLLNSLDAGVVDAVVAGHIHDVAHHWVNGVPVIQNVNGGYYSHVLYLTFNKTSKLLSNTEIEGPLPTCEKVFINNKRCAFVSKADAQAAGELTEFSFHGKVMKPDTGLDVVFQKWWEEVKQYKIKLTTTDLILQRSSEAEGVLGNLVADAIRNKTRSDLAVFNDGSLRSIWYPGEVLVEHVWNMFPFENTMVSFEMTGLEVKSMFKALQSGKKGFYHSSGVAQNVTNPPKALVNVRLYNGEEINENKTYTVGSNDFLLGGGDDFKSVLAFYTPKNVTNYGGLRDNMIQYIPTVGAIGQNLIDSSHPRLNIVSVKTTGNRVTAGERKNLKI